MSSPHVNVGASSGAVAPSSPLTSLPVVDGKGAQHPNPFVAHDDGDVITDPSFGSDDDEACSASATKRPRPSSAPVDHPDEVEQNGADHGVASEEEQGASRKRQRLDGSVDAHPDGENGDWDGILARMGSDGWESDSKLMLVSEKPSESNGEQISAETTEGSAANGGNEDGQMQLGKWHAWSPWKAYMAARMLRLLRGGAYAQIHSTRHAKKQVTRVNNTSTPRAAQRRRATVGVEVYISSSGEWHHHGAVGSSRWKPWVGSPKSSHHGFRPET